MENTIYIPSKVEFWKYHMFTVPKKSEYKNEDCHGWSEYNGKPVCPAFVYIHRYIYVLCDDLSGFLPGIIRFKKYMGECIAALDYTVLHFCQMTPWCQNFFLKIRRKISAKSKSYSKKLMHVN